MEKTQAYNLSLGASTHDRLVVVTRARGTLRSSFDDRGRTVVLMCVLILVIQTASRDSVYYTKMGVGTGGVVDMHR